MLLSRDPDWQIDTRISAIFASLDMSPIRDISRKLARNLSPSNVNAVCSRLQSPEFTKSLHLPLPTEPRQAGFAGEELLHRGLLDVALLGDQRIERGDQRIHIAQRGRNRALFRKGREQEVSIFRDDRSTLGMCRPVP